MTETMMLAATRRAKLLAMGAALAGLAVALAVLCAAPAMAQSQQTIAVLVNDEPISSYDVQQRVRLLTLTTRQKESERLRNKAIDQLIEEKLMMQEAKRFNIVVPQDAVQQQLAEIARRSKMSTKQLTAALRGVGINIHAFTSRLEAQIAWSMVIRNRYSQTVKVNPEDVESALQSQEGPKISTRYEYVLQSILFLVPKSASNAEVATRRNMAERFRRSFHSCSESRSQVAGLPDVVVSDIGKRSSEKMAPADRERFGKLSANQTTAPEKNPQGYELIAVCTKTEIKDEEQARRAAQIKLMNQEMENRSRQHLHDLKQDAVIERR